MKYFNFVLLCFLISCDALAAPDVEPSESLHLIVQAVDDNNWEKAMNLLLEHQEDSADINLLWGVWYDGIDNPLRDPVKSMKSLETAYKLGSREAQLLLVAKYLHTKDPNITNYKKGVELAADLVFLYKEIIGQGGDVDGELHRILGKFYLFGIGVDKHIEYGMQLLERAAALGDAEAKEIILKNH
ncbi:MAG: sel1 repeat family protein [Gammaproteobacteria bacterium]|nr:sel1 repeat family protein [Gammaproteobacteria bacterium]MBQ0773303.1 sel1 repeat family protein [Gammaproteobacteria bacterium]